MVIFDMYSCHKLYLWLKYLHCMPSHPCMLYRYWHCSIWVYNRHRYVWQFSEGYV